MFVHKSLHEYNFKKQFYKIVFIYLFILVDKMV